MGIFSSKKEVVVSSVSYNMAGDEKDRPNYLKSLVVRGVLGNSGSVATTLNDGYIKGPGIKLRSFFRWADKHYRQIGMPRGRLLGVDKISSDNLKQFISVPEGKRPWVQESYLSDADITRFAAQWLMLNFPYVYPTAWEADYDPVMNHIIIRTSSTVYRFLPHNFDKNSKYIYATYNEVEENTESPREQGNTVHLGSDPFPSTSSWNQNSKSIDNVSLDLKKTVTTVVEYTDSRPTERSTSETITKGNYQYIITEFEREQSRETNNNGAGITIKINKQFQINTENKRVNEETKTTSVTDGPKKTTTITTEQLLISDNSYRRDTQSVLLKSIGPLRMFIYRIGDGNTVLDPLWKEVENMGQFFPNIPVRLNNKMVDSTNYPTVYPLNSKAFRKSTTGKYTNLLQDIQKNPDLDKIDYAYVVFGVSLNVVDEACRRYIYELFSRIARNQLKDKNSYEEWVESERIYGEAYGRWAAWKRAQSRNDDPLTGSPEPVLPARIPVPYNQINLSNEFGFELFNYAVNISWAYMKEDRHTGQGRNGAKKGSIWFEQIGAQDFLPNIDGNYDPSDEVEHTALYYQIEDNEYILLTIVGLVHNNYVYQGKTVRTTAHEALDNPEESGFIIPLHYATYKELPLTISTQMATACVHIVFNCYEIHKKRWYERGFFRFLIVIAIAIVATVVTGGGGIGILGSNLALGSSLGFSGLTAAIVGAVANATVAMVVSTLLEQTLGGMFGGVIGALLTSVVGGFLSSGITNLTQGGLALNWGQLMKADNILKLADAVGKGYNAYVENQIMGMSAELSDLTSEAKRQSQLIDESYMSQVGASRGLIDPMMFATDNNFIPNETSSTFIGRTLMTGSDIADISLSMLSNFTDLTLKLPNAFD